MNEIEKAKLTESERDTLFVYRSIRALSVHGWPIAHHVYIGCTESERILETTEFMDNWMGNACTSNNASIFEYYSANGDNWTYTI